MTVYVVDKSYDALLVFPQNVPEEAFLCESLEAFLMFCEASSDDDDFLLTQAALEYIENL